MPDWNGFSGMYGGVGTDDSRFYAGVTNNISSIPHHAKGYINMDHSFVRFLQFLYPFRINHPLNIIIPNLLGITFIPFYVHQVTLKVSGSVQAAKYSLFLSLFCPVVLSNGLILMRDGWTAFFMIAGVFYLMQKRILIYFICLIILSYIRLGSGLLLALTPIYYIKNMIFSGSLIQRYFKVVASMGLIIVITGIGIPFILEYLLDKGVSGLARQEFVETIIKSADSSSLIYKIYSLPIFLKLPIGFIFFLLLPFLTFQFYTDGLLNIRNIMFTTIMPVLSLIYFKYFFSGIIYFYRHKKQDIKKLFYIFCFLTLIISQISIQPRHKTSVMPFFYILVAFGIVHQTKLSKQIGLLLMIVLGITQMAFLLI